ncbi:dephospho-CoA kinase [Natronospora cellulosivora (SeqCode)]
MLLGLTGGIASGKSTVSSYLEELGALIIDADRIAREVLEKGEIGYKQVVETFGNDILNESGEINRSKLAGIIFSNKRLRKKLENITHPLIIKKINEKIEEYRENNRIIILDAPLLFEVGLDKDVDKTCLVYVDKETQLKRLIKRDKLSKVEAQRRIESQLSLEKKRDMADIVINNQGSKKILKENVLRLWRDINEN